MDPKELLDESAGRGIDRLVVPVLVVMAIGLLFFLPKIYIANSIYLNSLQIERQQSTLRVLEDENRRLNRAAEQVAFELENP